MLSFLSSPRPTLQHALQAAVDAHRADLVRGLLVQQGPRRVADALSRCAPRVRDDALSMLPAGRRAAVARRLGPDRRGGLPPLLGLLTWNEPR